MARQKSEARSQKSVAAVVAEGLRSEEAAVGIAVRGQQSAVSKTDGKTPSLDVLRTELLEHYRLGSEAAKFAVEKANEAKVRAFLVGRCALLARRQLPADQDFGAWLKSCGPEVSRQTVYRWMQLAEAHGEDMSLLTTTVVTADPRQLKLMAAEIVDRTEGKSLRQLELDLGLRTAPVKKPRVCFHCKRPLTVDQKQKNCPHCGHDPRQTQAVERAGACTLQVAHMRASIETCVASSRDFTQKDYNEAVLSLCYGLVHLRALHKDSKVSLDGELVTPATIKKWLDVQELKASL